MSIGYCNLFKWINKLYLRDFELHLSIPLGEEEREKGEGEIINSILHGFNSEKKRGKHKNMLKIILTLVIFGGGGKLSPPP